MGRPADANHGPTLILEDRRWVLRERENIIGRGAGVAVHVALVGVSRHHARIIVTSNGAMIEDLGSKNGTFVGQERTHGPQALQDRDVIGLGRRVRLLFREREDDRTESEALHGTTGAMFRQEGELWAMVFEGQAVRLPDAKGFHDLARLLTRPGIDVHCLDLARRPAENAGEDRVLDDRAQREIGARARELQREIDEAAAAHDLGRAEQAREELEQIVALLSGALGLGGRSRGLGSAVERARSSVTWRMRSAIKRIQSAHPRLGRHLQNAVRTGTFCTYLPEAPVDWVL